MTKLKASEVKDKLFDGGVYADKVHVTNGVYVARFGYFYPHGQTSWGWAERVKVVFPESTLTEHSNHFHEWPRASYFEVRFTLPE